MMKKRALLSLSDKAGLEPLLKALNDANIELISTGGTKKTIEQAGYPVLGIEEVTQFPEMLDGRVKTLHPMVHGGLLYRRDLQSHIDQVKEHNIQAIDYVIVNLYPFFETISKPNVSFEEAIENIDIGGPSMLRSAAKNHESVTVICDPSDYPQLIEELNASQQTSLAFRKRCATKVFQLTASYDAMIANYLSTQLGDVFPERFNEGFKLKQTLRYGENPHQQAAFYESAFVESYSVAHSTQIQGKELSYNNIQDANSALQLLSSFDKPACVGLKHMNPCGVAQADNVLEAWKKTYEADPVSIFGGIVAFNREVTQEIAQSLTELFLEVICAPSYTLEAKAVFAKKKNLRVLEFKTSGRIQPYSSVRVAGGLLVQEVDLSITNVSDYKCVTKIQPKTEWLDDCVFGEKVVKQVKSNAIVIVKNGQSIGIGAGQMNRVGAAKLALDQAADQAHGATLASDAFFPMDDTVRLAAQYGIKCIIQPGGSIKDEDSIKACDELGICMVFTGERHFKH